MAALGSGPYGVSGLGVRALGSNPGSDRPRRQPGGAANRPQAASHDLLFARPGSWEVTRDRGGPKVPGSSKVPGTVLTRLTAPGRTPARRGEARGRNSKEKDRDFC